MSATLLLLPRFFGVFFLWCVLGGEPKHVLNPSRYGRRLPAAARVCLEGETRLGRRQRRRAFSDSGPAGPGGGVPSALLLAAVVVFVVAVAAAAPAVAAAVAAGAAVAAFAFSEPTRRVFLLRGAAWRRRPRLVLCNQDETRRGNNKQPCTRPQVKNANGKLGIPKTASVQKNKNMPVYTEQ